MRQHWPSSLNHLHTPEAIAMRLAHRRHPSIVRDLVYGAIDGTVTTFSIVAGVSGADLSTSVILILGISNVISDGFSMAAGNYLATKAEHDEMLLLKDFESNEINVNPSGETEEIRQIFKAKGFEGALLDTAVEKIVRNREEWIRLMLTEEYGLSLNVKSSFRAGLFTFLAFVTFGMIPMFPYAIQAENKMGIATIFTGISFFILGALKSKWSLEPLWKSGLKTFILGSSAAGLAYLVGMLLKDLV